MKRSPIVALTTAALVAVAITGFAVSAFADAPQPVVVASTQPLSIPASYRPHHFLKVETKGAGGVTLVQPSQPVVLAPAAVSSTSVGVFTGDASASSMRRESVTHVAKRHTNHAARSKPKKPARTSHKAKKPAARAPHESTTKKPHEPYWEWLLHYLEHHHHHHRGD